MADQKATDTGRERDAHWDVLRFPAPGSPQRVERHLAAAEQVLAALHARFYGPLMEFASAYVNRLEADDVVQEAFWSLWNRYLSDTSRDLHDGYEALLFNTVQWRIQDRERQRKVFRHRLRHYARELKSFTRRWMQADHRLVDDHLTKVIAKARAEMTPRCRDLHVMRYQAGLDVSEIAALTGTTRGSVSALLTKANRIMRQHLEQAGYGPATRRLAEGHGND